MTTQNLPTDDLKKYGIFNSDNTFTKKLSEEDIQKFLSGDIIIADNDKHRVTFQLKEQNSKLKVNVFERDKSISELLINSKNEIQYSDTISKYNINEEKTAAQLSWTKSAFIFDEQPFGSLTLGNGDPYSILLPCPYVNFPLFSH